MYPEKVLERVQEIEKISESLQDHSRSSERKESLKILKEKIIECCIYISELNETTEYGISIEVV